jgi:hypothetical protein
LLGGITTSMTVIGNSEKKQAYLSSKAKSFIGNSLNLRLKNQSTTKKHENNVAKYGNMLLSTN